MKKIAIAGTGYVGLVTGVSLAEIGHEVVCVDKDQRKIESLLNGKATIYEPNLEDMMKKNMSEGRLSFTTSPSVGYKDAEIIIITVGTPKDENGTLDLQFIEQAAKEVGSNFMKNNVIIVTKSTVPVGANTKIQEWVQSEIKGNRQFNIAANPEFLRQGSAIYDTFHGDRIIIGAERKEVLNSLEELYRPFGIPIMKTDIKSAELIKTASNAFLALKISYANTIAVICEQIGANIEDVSLGVGMDTRIGTSFLKAGIGFGGSCLPKDTAALATLANEVGEPAQLITDILEVNKRQELSLLKKAINRFQRLEGKNVALLGLSFKPGTDDVRDAVSLTLAKRLVHEGARVTAYDPAAVKNTKKVIGDLIFYADSIEDALKNADLAFIVTEWEEITSFPLNLFCKWMKEPVIFDGRNCFQLEVVKKFPIEYYSIGRPSVRQIKY